MCFISSSFSKLVLDHVVCYGLEASFCQTLCRSFAMVQVLQNLFGDSSPLHTVDMIFTVLSLFVFAFYHKLCLEFLHYFLISTVA